MTFGTTLVISWLYPLLQSNDFPETPCPAISPRGLHHSYVWSQSVYNVAHFTWRTKYSVSRISSTFKWIFWNSMSGTRLPFLTTLVSLVAICNKGHFTWKTKYLVSCKSYFIQGIFLKLHIWYSVTMAYNIRKVGSNRSVVKGTWRTKCTAVLIPSSI